MYVYCNEHAYNVDIKLLPFEICLIHKQGLPFHNTIVQGEFTSIAQALLFSHRSDCDKHIFCLHSKNILYYKTQIFFKLKAWYVLKTHFFMELKMCNFTYVDEMKIKIRNITSIFL